MAGCLDYRYVGGYSGKHDMSILVSCSCMQRLDYCTVHFMLVIAMYPQLTLSLRNVCVEQTVTEINFY